MCPSSTLDTFRPEASAPVSSSWKAPLPYPTSQSALATACSPFQLPEWMPLPLESCLPSHQAKPLHLNAALSFHSPQHVCQPAPLVSYFLSSLELPEDSMATCLSILFTLCPLEQSQVHRECSARAVLILSWVGTLCGQIPQ